MKLTPAHEVERNEAFTGLGPKECLACWRLKAGLTAAAKCQKTKATRRPKPNTQSQTPVPKTKQLSRTPRLALMEAKEVMPTQLQSSETPLVTRSKTPQVQR